MAGAAGGGSMGVHQVVPDVTASVLLLQQQGPLPVQETPVDPQLLQEQLAGVSRCVAVLHHSSFLGTKKGKNLTGWKQWQAFGEFGLHAV